MSVIGALPPVIPGTGGAMEMPGAAGNHPGVHQHGQEMEKQLFQGIGGRQSSP